MAGRVDDLEAAEDRQDVAVLDRADRRRLGRHRREHPAPRRPPRDVSPADREALRVGRVHQDVDPERGELARTTGVVGVTVGDDDAPEVPGRPSLRGDGPLDPVGDPAKPQSISDSPGSRTRCALTRVSRISGRPARSSRSPRRLTAHAVDTRTPSVGHGRHVPPRQVGGGHGPRTSVAGPRAEWTTRAVPGARCTATTPARPCDAETIAGTGRQLPVARDRFRRSIDVLPGRDAVRTRATGRHPGLVAHRARALERHVRHLPVAAARPDRGALDDPDVRRRLPGGHQRVLLSCGWASPSRRTCSPGSAAPTPIGTACRVPAPEVRDLGGFGRPNRVRLDRT